MRKLIPQISLITIFILAIGFFAVPGAAHAQATTAPTTTGASCATFDIMCYIFGGTNVVYGWMAKIFWWVLIPLASTVFSLLGSVIDLALAMSFQKDFYNAEAIGLAWSVIRDIANMFFIFVLIYEGIKTVLNLGNLVSVRKTITSVILAAIFLNFSLFFTKAIIDVSNVAAAWFMQGITNIGGNSSVSYSIGSTLGMEKLAATSRSDVSNLSQIGLQSFTTGVLLFALLCVAIYVFFNFLFLVIGRIVSFMFLLITAPIGFVGPLVPMLQDYSKKWWKELNNQAMMLPMFFLMVYLTLFIVDRIQNLLLSNASTDFSPANYVIFIIIIMMLLKALEVAEEYSGELGKMFGGLAKNATTFVGGAALIGTVGRAASALKSSEFLQNAASKNSILGSASRGLMMGADATANASFGTKSAYSATLKATGLDKTALKDKFKGTDKGYAGKKKEEAKEDKEFAENFKGEKAGERKREYAEYLKGKGTGMLGMTLRASALAAGTVGLTDVEESLRGGAKNLKESSGRFSAGAEMMKKDKDIAELEKKEKTAARDKLKERVDALKKEKEPIDSEISKLERDLADTPAFTGLMSNAAKINELKAKIQEKKAAADAKASAIEKEEKDMKKLDEDIGKKQKAIEEAEETAALKKLKDEIKKDEKEGGEKAKEEKPPAAEGEKKS